MITEKVARGHSDCSWSNGGATEFAMLKQVYGLAVEVNDWPISTEPDKWMAEIPALPGCTAWGDTPEEAIEIISDLAVHFMEDEVTERAPTTDVPTG